MKRTTCLTSLLAAVLLLSASRDAFVSAQGAPTGTVQKALIDYFLSMNQTPAPPPQNLPSSSSSSGSHQQTPNLATTNTGSSGSFDLYNQLMQSPPQTTSSPVSSGGGSVGEPIMNSLSQMPSGSQTQQTLQGSSGGSSSSSTDPFSMFNQVSGGASSPSGASSNPMTFHNQLMQTMNQSPNQAGGSQPLSAPIPDPFPTTQAPITLKPLPKVLPFVPPEWNLANSQNQHHQHHQSMWGSGSGSGSGSSSSWGHSSILPAHTAWAHHHRPQVQPPRDPPPHPMSQMMMIPRVHDMINKQAVQFGDLAYYQQHGCVDPTPTRPGPGGIRPTQTLWYGCQSRVSQMVCMRVGKRSGGKSGMMAMMMSMMNPTMTRTLEKCLSPSSWSQMMMKGFSGGGMEGMGGMGGMNPMMMMAMNSGGGGGGGLAGMMPMIMMMNQLNQPSPQSPSPTSPSMSNSFPATPAKQTYPDPSRQNTLISQAARIPHGAAQPQPQSSGTSVMDSFASMLGLGSSNTQTSSPSQIPSGAALPGMSPASAGMTQAPSTSPGQVDCSSLMPLMMSKVMAVGEGMNSPEALEAIGELRKQYLPYSCQELRLQYTGLPLRLCCPGRVDPPSVFDLFKAKNAGSA